MNPHRSRIERLHDSTERPLWSVMIPVYNCGNYLEKTLLSVLRQDPGPDLMQIEVVDDCSTEDDPAAIVRDLSGTRVGIFRQPQNVGHTRNFDTCLQRSRGRLVHLLHGDDLVLNGFYRKLQNGFERHPEVGAAFCRHIYMDEFDNHLGLSWLESPQCGVLDNWLERIAVQQRIQTPSIVVRRKVYELLGGFDRRILFWGEDWEMWVRIAAHYAFWYEPEPLALYRQRSASLSAQSMRTGANIRDFRRAINIVQKYLPPAKARQLKQAVLINYADYACSTAAEFIRQKDVFAAASQLREAFLCHASLKTLLSLASLIHPMIRATISGTK
jgi:glycosyltransferase involved in cell wall biosynthesis